MNLTFLRNEVKKIIDQNATTVTIQRENLISDGMDGYIRDPENPYTTVELTIRLYNKRYSPTVVTDGGVSFNTHIKALCDYNADILEGDTFTVDGITYKVKNIDFKKYYAAVISKECTLERVK